MNLLLADMDALEREFGCVVGDFNLDGVLNTALQLRGQQFFLDMMEDPALAGHICDVVAETQLLVARLVAARTGTTSVSVNRSIVNVDPAIYLHSNCSVQMVSPALYKERLLPYDCRLARELRPYGIHHCGNNLHRFAPLYAATGAVFYDVGWGSDVAAVGRALPGRLPQPAAEPRAHASGKRGDRPGGRAPSARGRGPHEQSGAVRHQHGLRHPGRKRSRGPPRSRGVGKLSRYGPVFPRSLLEGIYLPGGRDVGHKRTGAHRDRRAFSIDGCVPAAAEIPALRPQHERI